MQEPNELIGERVLPKILFVDVNVQEQGAMEVTMTQSDRKGRYTWVSPLA
jgi:hypothetical protein